jgi:DNA-binding GntR family transcriptional regulator
MNQAFAIESVPAAQRAYRLLEGQIVRLELSPGAALTEAMLIDRCGLGRTPVREAVQRLSWEGLLEVRPRAGILVAPLHPGDWVRVIDARRGVEAVLARSAARYRTDEQARRFHEAAMVMQQAVMATSAETFLDADKNLDEIVAAAADNTFAARLAAPLQTHSRRFWYRFRNDAALPQSAAHHVALIQAIVEKDGERAAAESDRLMDLLRTDAVAAAS